MSWIDNFFSPARRSRTRRIFSSRICTPLFLYMCAGVCVQLESMRDESVELS